MFSFKTVMDVNTLEQTAAAFQRCLQALESRTGQIPQPRQVLTGSQSEGSRT